MENFFKAAGMVLLAVILTLTIGKTEKDISLVLSMVVCCIISGMAIFYIEPVIGLLWEFLSFGTVQRDTFSVLLKVAGVTMVSELICTLCADAGRGSIGKAFHFLGSSVVLYLSVPLLRSLIALIQDLLGIL